MGLEKFSKKIEKEQPYLRYVNNHIVEKRRPKMEEFKNNPDYKENKDLVEKLEGKIAKEENEKKEIGIGKSEARENKSKAFEGFFVLEGKRIFGEEAEVVPTTKFDDLVNKIDLVLEVPSEGKIIRLGIDVSVSDVEMNIKNKAQRVNQERINQRKIGIRYFKSILDSEIKGELKNIPRVVIVISPDLLNNFIITVNNPKTSFIAKNYLFTRIKPQLENQFVYELFRNRERIEVERLGKEKEGTYLRLRKKHQEIVDGFYDLAKEISKGAWQKMPELIGIFDVNREIFKKNSVMTPEFFEFSINIKNVLQWVSDFFEKIQKENAIPSIEGIALSKGIRHWDATDFS